MGREIYKARWVLPVDSAPIDGGRVVVEDGLIIDLLPAGPSLMGERDFGDAILMPGFVNAHTHVEYTALRGFLEDVPFFPWVRALTMSKALIDDEGWLVSTRLGAMESISGGVTTIGDNTDAGLTARIAAETGMRAVVFQEIFGIDDREPVDPIVAALKAKIEARREFESRRVSLGVSPHALYTVRPALFEVLAADPVLSTMPWSIHIAESPAESELTEFGAGPFAEMYERRGISWKSPMSTPTKYASTMGALRSNSLAIHCVHQTPEDIELALAAGTSIVHCPKSNGKLGAGWAPLAEWLAAGVNVAIGTDSAVSNNTLDMFEEMRFAVLGQRARRRAVEVVTARDVVRMATIGGARALGLDAVVGSLTVGKRADMIAVDLDRPHSTPASDPYAALVYASRADDVVFTMVDGEVLFEIGHFTTVDAGSTPAAARELRRQLEENRNG